MLTLEQCRELLGADCPMTDEEVMKVHDNMRLFVEMMIEDSKGEECE